MLNIDMRKIYNFHPVEPTPNPESLPVGGDIYYECLDCSVIVSSMPYINVSCSCGNLSGSDGDLKVKNLVLVQVVRGTLK